MNFERFKAKTDLLIKKGLESDEGLSVIVVMERCSAIKEFLGEAYDSVLTESERDYIEMNIEIGMKRMIKDVIRVATKDPELFKEMMNEFFGKDSEKGGEF